MYEMYDRQLTNIYNELSCVFKLVVELNSELKFVFKYYGSYYFRKTVDTENFIKIYIYFFMI